MGALSLGNVASTFGTTAGEALEKKGKGHKHGKGYRGTTRPRRLGASFSISERLLQNVNLVDLKEDREERDQIT